MSNSSAGRRLADLLAPVIEQIGIDLENVEVVSAGKRRLVRVLVDSDTGVSLDDVSAATQAISAVLDAPAADAVLGSAPYVLEVSSPGVDRPLTAPKHWRRAIGRLVRANLTGGGEVTGRIVEADDDGVRLAPSDDPKAAGELRALTFAEIGSARVQVEFNRPGQSDNDNLSHLHAEEPR